MNALSAQNARPVTRIRTPYRYDDRTGKILYQVVRSEPKGFYVRRPDGQGGWLKGLGPVEPVLYRWPQLQGKHVIAITEGEKDADTLRGLGLTATTNPFGAGKWREEYTRQLRDAKTQAVVIFEDHDAPGREHAEQLARSCAEAGLRVKVVQFRGMPEGSDITDWLEGLPRRWAIRRRALRQLIRRTPEFRSARKLEHSDRLRELRVLAGGVAKGNRNNAAARLAGYLLANGRDEAQALRALRTWNRKNRPPLREHELTSVVASVARREQRNHPDRWTTSDSASSPGLGNLSGMSAPWRITPSKLYLRTLSRFTDATSYLWGKFLPAESVVMIVGEASAGKTVFLHRLAHELALGRRFLGITPPQMLRVLHLDVESPAVVERTLLRKIGSAANWHIAKVDERHLLRMIRSVGKKYDVIIVDSLLVALRVRDENNNAEASEQVLKFVKVARKTGAAIILAHNSGEGNPKEKFKARGATARVDRVDIVWNLDEVQGRRCLKVVKSRFGNLGDALEFGFAGNAFDYRLIKGIKQPKTKQQGMERRILTALRARQHGLTRDGLMTLLRLNKQSSTQVRLFDRTLKALQHRGVLNRPQRGTYALTNRRGR